MTLADTLSFEQSLVVRFPPVVFNILCVGGPVLVTLFFFGIVRLLVPSRLLREHHDVASALFTTIGTIYGIFLAFIVATTWQYYNTTATNVNDEALHLGILYANTNAYSPEFRATMKKELRDYRQTIVDKEWPKLAKGQSSAEAEHLLNDITQKFISYEPLTFTAQSFFTESVHNLNLLKQLRDQRLNDAASGLIPLLWFVLFAGALITIAFTFLFGANNVYAQIIMIALFTIVISLTLFTIVNLDFPFTGQVAISPAPFVNLKME